MEKFDEAIMLVRAERERQVTKWGKQRHDVFTWMTILTEEVGEAAKAAIDEMFGGKRKGMFGMEMIQVAAVAVQIIEWILED